MTYFVFGGMQNLNSFSYSCADSIRESFWICGLYVFLWATCSSCQPVKTLKEIQSTGPKQEKSPNGLVLSCGQMSDKSECQEHACKAVVACMKKILSHLSVAVQSSTTWVLKKFVTRRYIIKCFTAISENGWSYLSIMDLFSFCHCIYC